MVKIIILNYYSITSLYSTVKTQSLPAAGKMVQVNSVIPCLWQGRPCLYS